MSITSIVVKYIINGEIYLKTRQSPNKQHFPVYKELYGITYKLDFIQVIAKELFVIYTYE